MYQGQATLLHDGEDEVKLHALRIDGWPELYVSHFERGEKIRPRWEHVANSRGEFLWTTADMYDPDAD